MRTAGAADPAFRCGGTRADGGGTPSTHECTHVARRASALIRQDCLLSGHRNPASGMQRTPFRGTACCARQSSCYRSVSCCAGDFHSDSLKLRTSRLGTSGTRKACAKLFSRSIAISFVKRAAAGEWSFGLCATRSREPRQARKGATVPGLPWAPQTTRSSSRRQPAILPGVATENFPGIFFCPSAIHNIVSLNSFPRFASNIFIP
jgi:hypothetical protein